MVAVAVAGSGQVLSASLDKTVRIWKPVVGDINTVLSSTLNLLSLLNSLLTTKTLKEFVYPLQNHV